MDFKELAELILEHIGGKSNVKNVVHCATRLRFTLKDDSKHNTDSLKKTPGIFQPIIPAITSAGLLKALMALFSSFGVLKAGTQTHAILNAMADAAFYFMPVTKAVYASSVIPIILGVWFMSVVEHWVQKISHRAIKFFSVPLVTLFVGGAVTITLLGPIGSWV